MLGHVPQLGEVLQSLEHQLNLPTHTRRQNPLLKLALMGLKPPEWMVLPCSAEALLHPKAQRASRRSSSWADRSVRLTLAGAVTAFGEGSGE